MKDIAIVIVAYNRVKSLERLLNSLSRAEYHGHRVTLIISIDNSGSDDVFNYANNYKWLFGEKKIIKHSQNLGLKKHVISCGKLSQDFDAIVVLEDDIYVSQHFYNYTIQTIDKYTEVDSVAGISLYSHSWNVGVGRPFTPLDNGQDAYFLQFAQSWGQVWTKRMWEQFYKWYLVNNGKLEKIKGLPSYILRWPDSSWLKYHIGFVFDTNRYFVYPYKSLTTNFTDEGTHNKISSTNFQVPMQMVENNEMKLPSLDNDALKYDVYFEMENIKSFFNMKCEDVCIDIYGLKGNYENSRYWLTSNPSVYKVKDSFSLVLKPQEMNIIMNLRGNEIFLYDTLTKEKEFSTECKKKLELSKIKYDIKFVSKRKLLILLNYEIKEFLIRKSKVIFRLK